MSRAYGIVSITGQPCSNQIAVADNTLRGLKGRSLAQHTPEKEKTRASLAGHAGLQMKSSTTEGNFR
jgi:hypothetical protein